MKKNQKRNSFIVKACFAFLILSALVYVTGCNSAVGSEKNSVDESDGECYVSTKWSESTHIVKTQFKFDPLYLISGDNQKYNKDLALLTSELSLDIYKNGRILVIGKESDEKSFEDNKGIYSDVLEMKDIEEIYLAEKSYTTDSDDISKFIICHNEYEQDGNTYSVIILTIEGTDGSTKQWLSNCDVGEETGSYTELTGEHPEWTDKKLHKGFFVASMRVKKEADDYIEKNVPPQAQKIILLTGHSRGAAIANILGSLYENDSSVKSFTYTFATPSVTTEKDTSCKTIFNILNEDDMVPSLPPENIGFTLYGTNKSFNFSTEENKKFYSENVHDSDNKSLSYEPNNLSEWKDLINSLSETREDVYKIETRDWKSVKLSDYTVLKNAGLDKFMEIDSAYNEGDENINVKIMPAVFYSSLAYLSSSEIGLFEKINYVSFFNNIDDDGEKKYFTLLTNLVTHLQGNLNAHEPITYVLCAEKSE